jgi:hypothetical protein
MPLLPVILAELITGTLAMAMSSGRADDNWIPTIVACLLGLGYSAYTLLAYWTRDRSSILYNAYLYLVLAGAVYFFFGPLVYVFGPDIVRAYVIAQYPVSASDVTWITGAHLLALGMVSATFVTFRFDGAYRWAYGASRSYSQLPATQVLIPVLVACLLIKYLVILPLEFEVRDDNIPAPLRLSQQFISFALYIVFSRVASGQRAWWPFAIILLITEFGTGLVTFNKSTSIIAGLFAALGWLSKRLDLKAIAAAGAILLVSFEFLMPLATYGREHLSDGEGGMRVARFSERAMVLRSYMAEGAIDRAGYTTEGMSWARICYVPVQKAAIDLFDEGSGGNDWELIGWLVVPRVLYPSKPFITNAGPILYEKMTGFAGSAISPGIFVDAYYNSGLIGALAISFIVGLFLALYTAIGRGVIEGGGDLMYPLVAFGIYRGLRVDGTILADVFGSLVIYGALVAMFAYLEPKRRRLA